MQNLVFMSTSPDFLGFNPLPGARRAARRQLEPEDVREYLAAFGTGKLHQLGFRGCGLKRAGDLDGSRKHLRIFDCDLVVEDVGVDPRVALDGVQSVTMVRDRAPQG